MKTNKITRFILGVTLAASMAIPTAAISGASMTSYAAQPFCADTDGNGAINIDESQINVNTSFYSTNAIDIPVRKTNGTQFTTKGWIRNLEALSHATISLEISGTNLQESALDNLELRVQYAVDGKYNIDKYKPVDVEPKSNGSFIVSYDTVTYGDSFTFLTSEINGISNLNCTSAKFTPVSDSSNFLKVEVSVPEGEKLFIRIKNDPSMSNENINEWAKRICMYANSLSDVTGATLDTIYMNFDRPADSRAAGSAFSANWYINEAMDKYGFVGFDTWTTDMEREQIASGRNVITWSVMHEIAHSYCCGVAVSGRPLVFDSDYKFHDDYLNNTRGLTAIQNCDNLRNTNIHYRQFFGNDYTDFYQKYDSIFQTVSYFNSADANDPYKFYKFGYELTRTDWEKLESFFAADSDNVSNLNECSYVARMLNSYMGTNISLNNNDFLKLANVIRKLMVLENGSFDENSFDSFMNGRFTPELLKKMVDQLGYTK